MSNVKPHTAFQLRQMASIDIQAVAQTCAMLSDGDISTYLDYITIGVHGLRRPNDHLLLAMAAARAKKQKDEPCGA